MAVIYRVNMSDLSVRVEEPQDACKELGGRGLTSTLVAGEVPPRCHPLSAENKLVIAPGVLTGTGAPCSGRLSTGAKSPLTRTIKESNSGGQGELALAALGVQAIVLEGKPADRRLYRLVVNADGLRVEPGDDLAGLGNYDTVARQHEQHGDKIACLSIGQAGEMQTSSASIAVTDVEGRPTRHCGRGGLGAVMGSKRVKAIVVDPAGGKRVQPADAEAFRAAVKKFPSPARRCRSTARTSWPT
jgi:aldehyde:ferredoxin oxidoreductase